jgi:hypothetical protein
MKSSSFVVVFNAAAAIISMGSRHSILVAQVLVDLLYLPHTDMKHW